MPRRSAAPTLQELLARVAALEERVGRVEAGRAPKGDGRAASAPEAKRKVERCPGCGLPLRRRNGRCLECGRPD